MPGKMPPIPAARALPGVDEACIHTPQSPAGKLQAQAQVHILAVHEIPAVEAADSVPDLGGQHDAGCIDPIHPPLFTPKGSAAPQGKRCGQFALAILQASKGVHLHGVGAAHASLAASLHQLFEYGLAGKQLYVGVEHAKEIFGRAGQRLIVVGAKALGRGVARYL
jgi:hypothetical protein